MSLTGFRVHIELRNARRWLASILLLALAGGAALTAAQAARRTDTAFTQSTRGWPRIGCRRQRQHLHHRRVEERLAPPQRVEAARRGGPVAGGRRPRPLRRRESLRRERRQDRPALRHRIGVRARGVRHLHRTHDLDAPTFQRPARPTRPGRRDHDQQQDRPHLRVAGRNARHQPARVRPEGPRPGYGTPRAQAGTRLSMRVVGIGELPDELLQPTSEREARVFLTPAFRQRFPDSDYYINEWVRLRRGHADLADLRQAVARINRAPRYRHAHRAHRRRPGQGEPGQRPARERSLDPRGPGGARWRPARCAVFGALVLGARQ